MGGRRPVGSPGGGEINEEEGEKEKKKKARGIEEEGEKKKAREILTLYTGAVRYSEFIQKGSFKKITRMLQNSAK